MKKFNHTNILGLLGVSIDAGSAPYVVLPYMANGSLLDWLKRERERIVLKEQESVQEEQVSIIIIIPPEHYHDLFFRYVTLKKSY